MKHYLSIRGYVFLFFFLYAGMTMIFNIITGNLYRIGAEFSFEVLLAMKIAVLFFAAFIMVGRFLHIEGRIPNTMEGHLIAFWAFFVLLLGMIVYLPIGTGLSKMRPDLDEESVKNAFLLALGVLSTCSFLFLQLNLNVLAKMRSVNG